MSSGFALLFYLNTASASKRRALRRARALARFRWHQHQSDQRPLSAAALAKVYRTLAGHHSRDLGFLARIAVAMASSKPHPWRCRVCQKTAKPSMPRCAWCGKTWQEVFDYTFQPPGQQPQGGQAQRAGPSQGQTGRPRTPRRRSRQGKHGHPAQAQQQAGPPPPGPPMPAVAYLPPGNWHPAVPNGPYTMPPMQQTPTAQGPPPFVQQMAPPPPPPMQTGQNISPDQIWMQQMQQMPVLGAVQSQAAGSTQSQAEMHLHRILGALRKSEDSWTPDIQSAVQEIYQ